MRDIPPTPPIESKEQEKEDTSSSPAGAREAEAVFAVLYAKANEAIRLLDGTHRPPRPERVIAYAQSIMGITKDFALIWYNSMTEQGWLDLDGEPIRNWTYMLRAWKNGEEYYKAKQALLAAEAKRMGEDAKRGVTRRPGPRKADNWIGTPPDRIEDVF